MSWIDFFWGVVFTLTVLVIAQLLSHHPNVRFGIAKRPEESGSWTKRASERHSCTLPRLPHRTAGRSFAKSEPTPGDEWTCSECSTVWRVITFHEGGLGWLGMGGRVRR